MRLTKKETIEKLRQGYDLVSTQYAGLEKPYFSLEKGNHRILNTNQRICQSLIKDLTQYNIKIQTELKKVTYLKLKTI